VIAQAKLDFNVIGPSGAGRVDLKAVLPHAIWHGPSAHVLCKPACREGCPEPYAGDQTDERDKARLLRMRERATCRFRSTAAHSPTETASAYVAHHAPLHSQ